MTLETEDFGELEPMDVPQVPTDEEASLIVKVETLERDLAESRAYSEKLQADLTEADEHAQFLEEDLKKNQDAMLIKSDAFEVDRAALEEAIAHHKDLESQLKKEIRKHKDNYAQLSGYASLMGLAIVALICVQIFTIL